MDSVDIKKISSIWNKNGKNLKKPSVLLSNYKGKNYYVFRDDTSIIFMIASNCHITLALPKKYCKLRKNKSGDNYYQIDNLNTSVVSCTGSPNEYEKFVIDNLVVNQTC